MTSYRYGELMFVLEAEHGLALACLHKNGNEHTVHDGEKQKWNRICETDQANMNDKLERFGLPKLSEAQINSSCISFGVIR